MVAARPTACCWLAAAAARNGRAGGSLDYQGFYDAYPFHPSLLSIITGRLSANRNFQRVRGTLRLLGNTLLEMRNNGSEAALMHPGQITPRVARIRDEAVNRSGFSELDPAIDTDIVGRGSTAEKTGGELAEAAAVTMLLGTIAPDASKGLYADQIASIAQGDDTGIVISLMAQNRRLQVGIRNAPPSEFKDYAVPARRMMSKAGVSNADVTVYLEPSAAQRALEKLNNRDEANITVAFGPPERNYQ